MYKEIRQEIKQEIKQETTNMGFTGFLKTQQKVKEAVTHVTTLASQYDAVRDGGSQLSEEGIFQLAAAAMTQIDLVGYIDLRKFAELADKVRAEHPKYGVDPMPYPNDAKLQWLQSLDDLKEASAAQIKIFLQPVAWDTKDADGSNAKSRFEARVAWLNKHKVHRPKVEAAPVVELTEEQQAQADIKARYDYVRDKIAGLGPAWLERVKKLKARLTDRCNDMIREKRSIDEIERYINAEISDYESGSLR
jgi:hypothetical protein